MDAGPFEHFTVLIEKAYRATSWQLYTRMYENIENMRSALDNVQKPWRKVLRGDAGPSVLTKSKCVKGDVRHTMSDWVCWLLGKVWKRV